jgi:Fe-S cluster biogenesis protein NfuA
MFIQTEQTPNPASLKFLPGCEVLGPGTAEFTASEAAAAASPLAGQLFKIEGVAGVFLGSDFITVSKSDALPWPAIKPLVLGVIMEHFSKGLPVMHDEAAAGATAGPARHQADENDSDVVRQIKEILDTRIRPAVAADGGDVVFFDFDDGVVYLEMRGACAGCPSSTMTLKAGIENLLRHFIPEVREVRAAQ